MKILAIETSCDETAIAFLEATGGLRAPKFKVLKNIVSSQIEIHRPWGGVVPNLAKREHIKNLPVVFKELTEDKKIRPDLLAVTVGPGLEPALWTGVVFAKELKKNIFKKIPLIGANHLEGHLYSVLLDDKRKLSSIFPAIALIVSGGHTILLRVDSLIKWKKLGETRDGAKPQPGHERRGDDQRQHGQKRRAPAFKPRKRAGKRRGNRFHAHLRLDGGDRHEQQAGEEARRRHCQP